MLEARATDGRYVPHSFTCGEGIGDWRPTSLPPTVPPTVPPPVPLTCTPPGVSDPFAWVARVDPFTLKSTSQFRTKGPERIGSRAYRKEYNEVKDYGGNGTTTPSLRTPAQLAVSQFFTANPIEMYNRTFRTISTQRDLTLVQQARLFAMLNIATADAVINCWDDKDHWSFWRPITAIRLGNSDGDDKTVGDSGWTSFIGTPPYPDHSSGYNCVTGAFMHVAQEFFGKRKLEFTMTMNFGSPPVPMARTYDRFTDVIEDTIDARVWQGIHFRSADEDGARIGKNVARWIDDRYFEPVRRNNCGDDDDDDHDD